MQFPGIVNRIQITGSFITVFSLLLGGCSRPGDQPSSGPQEKTPSVKSPPHSSRFGPDHQKELLSRIAAIDNFFALYDLDQEYRRQPVKSEEIKQALGKKWDQLREKKGFLGSMCEEIDLVDFDYRLIGRKENGDYEYRASCLFYAKETPSWDRDPFLVTGVDGTTWESVPDEGRKPKTATWTIRLTPKTSQWQAGEYFLCSETFTANPIPYKMSLVFSDYNKNGKYRGTYGNKINLGWRVDLGD